ncbi:hypothetical protein [Aureivirga marina]|uniref:hypothetical protein n=1 Tax=Aureivirga marina TaxID=1182451 RepID=UPI0018C924C1|nr:hypothetical protein [Aureivirga marina]
MNEKLTFVLRLFLSLTLIFLGVNHFSNFISLEVFNLEAINILGIKYFPEIVSICQIIGGGLILFKKWQIITLILLMPLSINTMFFYLKLDPQTYGLEAIVAVLNFVFIYHYWDKIEVFFKTKLKLKNL